MYDSRRVAPNMIRTPRMRRGFTLIELLTVIAIIAVLAGILFPVFAAARNAAITTSALTRQKQIATAYLMYAGDHDDRFPMGISCAPGSSLNPVLNDGVVRCGGANGIAHLVNYQQWPKYVYAYVKSVEVFEHPRRTKNQAAWDQSGLILHSFVPNLAMTGVAQNATTVAQPFHGGPTATIPNPSEAILLLESPHVFGMPVVRARSAPTSGPFLGYPIAIREYWEAHFFETVFDNSCRPVQPRQLRPGALFDRKLSIGRVDGGARTISLEQFLAETPTSAEYLAALYPASQTFALNCITMEPIYRYNGGNAVPVLNLGYPLWSLDP